MAKGNTIAAKREDEIMESVKQMLAWSTIINYAILLIWFVVFWLGRDWLARTHGRIFDVPPEKIKTMMYLLIGIYKLGILLFNFVPYVALWSMS
jgi:hypothetical protein